jgi:hypothetical protein
MDVSVKRHALIVDRVAAQRLPVEVVGGAEAVVGFVHGRIALFKAGMFRWDTLLDLRDLAPERVLLYAGVDTFATDRDQVMEGMEQSVERGAIGFKFYPSNGVFDRRTNKMVSLF